MCPAPPLDPPFGGGGWGTSWNGHPVPSYLFSPRRFRQSLRHNTSPLCMRQDITGRSNAMAKLVSAGMSLADAQKLVGLTA